MAGYFDSPGFWSGVASLMGQNPAAAFSNITNANATQQLTPGRVQTQQLANQAASLQNYANQGRMSSLGLAPEPEFESTAPALYNPIQNITQRMTEVMDESANNSQSLAQQHKSYQQPQQVEMRPPQPLPTMPAPAQPPAGPPQPVQPPQAGVGTITPAMMAPESRRPDYFQQQQQQQQQQQPQQMPAPFVPNPGAGTGMPGYAAWAMGSPSAANTIAGQWAAAQAQAAFPKPQTMSPLGKMIGERQQVAATGGDTSAYDRAIGAIGRTQPKGFGFQNINGQLFRTNPNTGQAEPITQAAEKWKPEKVGNSLVLVNESTGEIKPGISQIGNPTLEEVQTLRKTARTEFDRSKLGMSGINAVRATLVHPGSITDVGSLYNIVKALDPTSVVRESEVDLITSAGGIMNKLEASVDKALGDGFLTPKSRENIIELLDALEPIYMEEAGRVMKHWTDFGEKFGVDPKDFLGGVMPISRKKNAAQIPDDAEEFLP